MSFDVFLHNSALIPSTELSSRLPGDTPSGFVLTRYDSGPRFLGGSYEGSKFPRKLDNYETKSRTKYEHCAELKPLAWSTPFERVAAGRRSPSVARHLYGAAPLALRGSGILVPSKECANNFMPN